MPLGLGWLKGQPLPKAQRSGPMPKEEAVLDLANVTDTQISFEY